MTEDDHKLDRKLDDISRMLTDIRVEQAQYSVMVTHLSTTAEINSSKHDESEATLKTFEVRLTKLEGLSKTILFIAGASATASIGLIFDAFSAVLGGG